MSKKYNDTLAGITTNASKAVTPQSQAIPGRENEMAKNNAGGVTFTMDKWGKLARFLVIGAETNNYYVGRKQLQLESLSCVKECIKENANRVVDLLVEYSTAGRAPKNDPAIITLAFVASIGTQEEQKYAYDKLKSVCRTGTHLFLFVETLNTLGKWNANAKKGIATWYNRDIERLALQMLKYQQRNGWSHKDVLRLAHIKPTPEQDGLFAWVVKDKMHKEGCSLPKLVADFESLHAASTAEQVINIVHANESISWEMVPTNYLSDVQVLSALLPTMKLGALIRQLGKLSSYKIFDNEILLSIAVKKLTSEELLKAERVHPLSILQAYKQYNMGRGEKGSLSWSPNSKISNALDEAFYKSFHNVADNGKTRVIGVDCSGSMFSAPVNGSPNLNAAEVAAVFAMMLARRKSTSHILGFDTTCRPLNINSSMKIAEVLRVMQLFRWGGTDCAQPMIYAKQHSIKDVDQFIVITDNETWAGQIQTTLALRDYRKFDNNSTSSLAVIGTSVSQFTIADPQDPFMLDIAGFDSAVPQILESICY